MFVNQRVSQIGGLVLASALCLLGLFACSSGKKGPGSSLIGNGGSGGAGGSAGAPGLCLTAACQDGQAKIEGRIADECITNCGGQRVTTALQLATSWTRVGESAGYWTLFITGKGTSVDGQPAAVSYALYRVSDPGGALDRHWICATGGTLTPYTYSPNKPTPQPFKLTGLSDIGTCDGDDKNPDSLTLELDWSTSTVTGSIMGQAISLQGKDPFCTSFDCSLDIATDSPYAGSYFSTFSGENDTGAPVPLTDAIWVAPRAIGMDVICGSPKSTITRTPGASETTAHIEMHGLQGLHCPGTALAGDFSGNL